MTKYSGIVTFENRKFRYDYEHACLEWITFTDFIFDTDNKLVEITREKPIVLDACGLSVDDWKEDPAYWVERYSMDIDDEMSYIIP